MNGITEEFQSAKGKIAECLLRQVNSVSDSGLPSFEGRQLNWEASTLRFSLAALQLECRKAGRGFQEAVRQAPPADPFVLSLPTSIF